MSAWTLVGLIAAVLGIAIAILTTFLEPPPGDSDAGPPSATAPPTTSAPTASPTATPPVLGRVEIVVIQPPAAPTAGEGATQGWLTSLGTLLVGIAALLALLRRPAPDRSTPEPGRAMGHADTTSSP
ncbi:hypothetical protein [Asanoa siamensis]|uniref:MYXO-CTERM domain-containing protein n=1 Tax=Asanoa siamensis TaxID=926357 RepID=A0ABQ4CVF8_9ACTN|nr:hypothetical protein [Asanoa siamensis]GIF75243.1 hypothetical protein Asi02nite_47610 [Asanoa siamensis]